MKPDTTPPSTPEPRIQVHCSCGYTMVPYGAVVELPRRQPFVCTKCGHSVAVQLAEPPAAPAEGETAEGLSAELLKVARKLEEGGIGSITRVPVGYSTLCRALGMMRGAAEALTASREAQARQAEQIANVSDAIAEYCSRNGDKGVPADSADAVRFIGAEVSTLRAKLAEAERCLTRIPWYCRPSQ